MPDESQSQPGFWDTLSAAYKLLPDVMGLVAENIATTMGGTEQGAEIAGKIAEVGTRPAAQIGSAIAGGISSMVNDKPPTPPTPPTTTDNGEETSDNGETTWFNTWGLFIITLVGILIFAIFFMI